MSEVIKLVRLDCKENHKDNKTIVEAEVGPGETFLGRGPLLKIDVTSISRKHCRIKFTAETNQLLLTCNHRNSIFVKKSESKTWDELKDGNTIQLFHEDELRFLKEQFLFQVVAPFLGKNNDDEKENDGLSKVSHNTEPEDLEFTSNPQEFKENKPIDENTVVPDIAITPKPTGLKCEKKRKLPSWMNQPSGSGISPQKKQKTSPDKPNKYVENARFVNPELRGEKEKAEKENTENSVKVNNEENEDQDSISLLATNCNDKETRQSPAKKIQISPDVSDEDEECNENKENSKLLSHSNKERRSCPFGASCYRKNPIHRQEASHPGDDDYKDVNEEDKNDDDDDDDKPECEFGTDCYRKNPQHRKQFKHTVRPKKRRAAKAAKKKAKNEDAYDSDDSFINDEDDWEPVDDSDDDADFAPAAEDVSSDFEASAELSSELE